MDGGGTLVRLVDGKAGRTWADLLLGIRGRIVVVRHNRRKAHLHVEQEDIGLGLVRIRIRLVRGQVQAAGNSSRCLTVDDPDLFAECGQTEVARQTGRVAMVVWQ
jgi:hypothetical protein